MTGRAARGTAHSRSAAPSRASASGRGSTASRSRPASPAASATTRAGVTIDAFGDERRSRSFLDALNWPPPAARIVPRRLHRHRARTGDAFDIVDSEPGADRRVSIPPDLATCDDCLRRDLRSRRTAATAIAFTNCTNCGPRFTIATDIPYDRRATTMAPFEMCPACRREYQDVDDRRFHAQPNACPACGPRLGAARRRTAPASTPTT